MGLWLRASDSAGKPIHLVSVADLTPLKSDLSEIMHTYLYFEQNIQVILLARSHLKVTNQS